MKKRHYSDEFKEQALAKVLGRSSDQSVESVAADLQMSKGTLVNWMNKAQREHHPQLAGPGQVSEWTAAQRLLALQDSHGLQEEALNAWCREHGVFAHDLVQWHSDFCEAAGPREESAELRQLRLTNLQMQRDLNRKDKALAEAAALLVLQKKYRALWAAEDA